MKCRSNSRRKAEKISCLRSYVCLTPVMRFLSHFTGYQAVSRYFLWSLVGRHCPFAEINISPRVTKFEFNCVECKYFVTKATSHKHTFALRCCVRCHCFLAQRKR